MITTGCDFQNNYGDLIPYEREIRLTYKEAQQLLADVMEALRGAKEAGHT